MRHPPRDLIDVADEDTTQAIERVDPADASSVVDVEFLDRLAEVVFHLVVFGVVERGAEMLLDARGVSSSVHGG